jgi:hypothetical protein
MNITRKSKKSVSIGDIAIKVMHPTKGDDDFSLTIFSEKSADEQVQEVIDKEYPGASWNYIED